MNLKALRLLYTNVASGITDLETGASAVSCYYFHDKKWINLNETDEAPKSQKINRATLDAVKRSASGVMRPKGQTWIYVYVQKFECVLAIDTSKQLKVAAQARLKTKLEKMVIDADNQFGATHDRHTGLRNRSAFDTHLMHILKKSAAGINAEAGVETSIDLKQIFLASLDIDHFKLVNDRFGHGYGDIVLAAFAWRLEDTVRKIVSEMAGGIEIDVFRLGGEEFQIVVSGSLQEDEMVAIAERFRMAIREEELPTEEEYKKLIVRDFADGVSLPLAGERTVSTSLGVAACVGLGVDVERAIASRLKRQADIALASAKYGGRNKVRQFSSILNHHGRISSVDAVNGVISVDIGKEVGVKKGQEFFVYPPKYDGETPFYQGEGRSLKRVGSYPKYKVAMIAAFDVQNDVSFCRVIRLESGVSEITVGSTLEAIPLGSIAHLVSSLVGSDKLLGLDGLKKKIDEISTDGDVGVVAVFLRNMEQISEEQGLDKANECLGLIGQELINIFGTRAKFGQVSASSIVAVFGNELELDHSLQSMGDAIEARLGESVEFGIGWVLKPLDDFPPDLPALNPFGGMIDAALLSASINDRNGSYIRQFSEDVLGQATFKSRKARDFNRMTADYKMFSEFGTKSPLAETQMALMYSSRPNSKEEAEIHFRKASEVAGVLKPVLDANLACWLISEDKIDEGFALVRDLELPPNYALCRFYGAMKVLEDEDFSRFVMEREDEAKEAVSRTTHSWLNGEQRVLVKARLRGVLRP